MHKYEPISIETVKKHLINIFDNVEEMSPPLQVWETLHAIKVFYRFNLVEDTDGKSKRFDVSLHYKKKWNGLVKVSCRHKNIRNLLYSYLREKVWDIHKNTRVETERALKRENSCFICRITGLFSKRICKRCLKLNSFFNRNMILSEEQIMNKIANLKEYIALLEHLENNRGKNKTASDLTKKWIGG